MKASKDKSRFTNESSAGAVTEVSILGIAPDSGNIYPLSHFDAILTITLKMVNIFPHQDSALIHRQISPVAKHFYLPLTGLRNLLV